MRDRFLKLYQNAEIPEPAEIDCIITTKVYDACRQQECEFFEFDGDVPENWDFDDGITAFAEIVPNSVTFQVFDIELIGDGPLARVQLEVCARINVYLVNNDLNEKDLIIEEDEICFEKDVVLYLPEPDKMEVIAEAIFQIAGTPVVEPIENEEDGFIIFIPVGAFIIVKSTARVQLLIPTFGFCPKPPPCEEFPDLDVCEEFQLLPFPDFYPPQPSTDND